MSDVVIRDGRATPSPKHPPFAWHEKIAVLLLAAHLEETGWPIVRISVRADVVESGGLRDGERPPTGGLDWACLVEAVKQRGKPYVTADLMNGTARAGYERVSGYDRVAGGQRPVWGPQKLVGFLRSALDAEFARGGHDYHRDGIWHDDGAGFDLVAWKPGTTLIVEAKGAGMRTNATREVAQALGKLALNVRPGSGYRYGLLVPGDEATFLKVLGSSVAPNPLIDGLPVTIYSVARDGTVSEWHRSKI